MNKLPILIQREFWENRNSFLVLPAVITAFFILLMIVAVSSSTTGMVTIDVDLDDHMSGHATGREIVGELIREHWDELSTYEKRDYIRGAMQGLATPLFSVLWFVVLFYLMNSLYQDRQDRSILFWKSMPVSDRQTIAVKLITALVCVPVVYFVCVVLLQVFGLILMSFVTSDAEASIWENVWMQSGLLTAWMMYGVLLLFYVFWASPLYGWLLLVSSYVKSVPLVWVIGVPVGIVVAEAWLTRQSAIADWISMHIVPVDLVERGDLLDKAFSLQMVSGVVVGAAFIAGAIYLRGKADEI